MSAEKELAHLMDVFREAQEAARLDGFRSRDAEISELRQEVDRLANDLSDAGFWLQRKIGSSEADVLAWKLHASATKGRDRVSSLKEAAAVSHLRKSRCCPRCGQKNCSGAVGFPICDSGVRGMSAMTPARLEEIRELNAGKKRGHAESAVAHVSELLEEVARLRARAADLEGDLSVAKMAAQARVEGVTDRANAKIFEVETERDGLREQLAAAREGRALFKDALAHLVEEAGCSALVDSSGHAPELPIEYAREVALRYQEAVAERDRLRALVARQREALLMAKGDYARDLARIQGAPFCEEGRAYDQERIGVLAALLADPNGIAATEWLEERICEAQESGRAEICNGVPALLEAEREKAAEPWKALASNALCAVGVLAEKVDLADLLQEEVQLVAMACDLRQGEETQKALAWLHEREIAAREEGVTETRESVRMEMLDVAEELEKAFNLDRPGTRLSFQALREFAKGLKPPGKP